MSKILFFILGLFAGVALSIILYFKASSQYNSAQGKIPVSNSVSLLSNAQTLWPPYRIDSKFQKDLKKFQKKAGKISGPTVTIYLKEKAEEEKIQNLVNQLEVMKGVENVTWNSLARPKKYIKNMTHLPGGEDKILDNIIISANSEKNIEKIKEFLSLQEIITEISG